MEHRISGVDFLNKSTSQIIFLDILQCFSFILVV